MEVNESPLLGLSNLRAALQAFQLRDNLRRVGAELRWVASDYDLADAMTKKKADSRESLLKFLSTWHWSIAFDPHFLAAKKNKKAGLTAVSKVDHAMQHLYARAMQNKDDMNARLIGCLMQSASVTSDDDLDENHLNFLWGWCNTCTCYLSGHSSQPSTFHPFGSGCLGAPFEPLISSVRCVVKWLVSETAFVWCDLVGRVI